jgi:hypothetical protein
MAAIWRARGRIARLMLGGTWLVMVVAEVGLILLHPMMDRLLDGQAREVLDSIRFNRLHNLYLTVQTIQWGAGLLHVWFAVSGETT